MFDIDRSKGLINGEHMRVDKRSTRMRDMKPILHQTYESYNSAYQNSNQLHSSRKFDGNKTFISDPEVLNIRNRLGQVWNVAYL